jgi:hypothetical protein
MTWTLAAISGLDIWQILGDFKNGLKNGIAREILSMRLCPIMQPEVR